MKRSLIFLVLAMAGTAGSATNVAAAESPEPRVTAGSEASLAAARTPEPRVTAPDQRSGAIPNWFDASVSTIANAERAQRENVPPGAATATLIELGGKAPDAVVAVVKAYDSCDALFSSVEEGARRAPNDAGEIADRILDSGRCPCSSDQLWARSRLSNRLRIEARAEPVEASRACLCTAAVAEALARAIPGRAPEAFELALGRGKRCDCAQPAFAGVANALGDQSEAWIAAEQRLDDLRRDGGRVIDVVSDPEAAEGAQVAHFLAPGSVATQESADCRAPLVTMGGAAQQAMPRCRAFARPDIAISRYQGSTTSRRAVELRGDGESDIDLAASNVVLDLYVEGKEQPERRIALTGILPKDGRFVVATKEPPPGFAAKVDQETDELDLPQVGAVVLRQLGQERWCSAELAGAARRYPEAPIAIAAPPEPTVVGEPRTDESNVDPRRGGEIASPN
ncbi:MAG TPA: hypothetical protein VFL14_07815 [Xanthomonadales bacterium]|nr:hypothetical protein [Xanthomonadales bacterium]